MNYTENYHLPQWDEDDRILRKDFNQMCADIEGGLTNSRDSNGETRSQAWTRICRMAYNHYCAVQDMEPFPCQIGLFHQNFEKDPSGLTGTTPFNGIPFAGKGSATLTNELMSERFQLIEPLHAVKDNLAASKPLRATLRMPASGCAYNYYFGGTFSNLAVGSLFRIRITVTDQNTGCVTQSSVAELTNTTAGAEASFTFRIKTPIYFLGGVDYLVTMELVDAVCNMDASVGFVGSGIVVVSFANEGIVTADAVVHEPLGGRGGMVILRCSIGGNGGDLKLLWDGVECQPYFTRTVTMLDGRGWQELIYLREDEISDNSKLSLRFECRPEGSILLYDWGMILL